MQASPTKEKRKHTIKEGTPRQKKLAQGVLEAVRTRANTPKTKLLQEAGYSLKLSQQPSRIIESQGFLVEMAKLGLTKEKAVSALVFDIDNKPLRRAFELSIAGKWLGLEQKNDTPNNSMSIQNAVINIQLPDNGSTKPQIP